MSGFCCFDGCILPHWKVVFKRALRLCGDVDLAEDLTQETYAAAYKDQRRFIERDPGYEQGRRWLYTILKARWYSHLDSSRFSSKIEYHEDLTELEHAGVVQQFAWADINDGDEQQAREKIDGLKEPYRTALHEVLSGLSTRQIRDKHWPTYSIQRATKIIQLGRNLLAYGMTYSPSVREREMNHARNKLGMPVCGLYHPPPPFNVNQRNHKESTMTDCSRRPRPKAKVKNCPECAGDYEVHDFHARQGHSPYKPRCARCGGTGKVRVEPHEPPEPPRDRLVNDLTGKETPVPNETVRVQDVRESMRERSGAVNCNRLESFLYLLMRGYVVSGVVEELMDEIECKRVGMTFRATNGWLAEHAKDIARRLIEVSSGEENS